MARPFLLVENIYFSVLLVFVFFKFLFSVINLISIYLIK